MTGRRSRRLSVKEHPGKSFSPFCRRNGISPSGLVESDGPHKTPSPHYPDDVRLEPCIEYRGALFSYRPIPREHQRPVIITLMSWRWRLPFRRSRRGQAPPTGCSGCGALAISRAVPYALLARAGDAENRLDEPQTGQFQSSNNAQEQSKPSDVSVQLIRLTLRGTPALRQWSWPFPKMSATTPLLPCV